MTLTDFTIIGVGSTVAVKEKMVVSGCMAPKNTITDPTGSMSQEQDTLLLELPTTSSRYLHYEITRVEN